MDRLSSKRDLRSGSILRRAGHAIRMGNIADGGFAASFMIALSVAPAVQAQQTDGAVPQSQTATGSSPATGIEDIIVTASRRSSSIRETPSSIAAFDGNRLQQAQITSLDALAPTTPNVQISTVNTTSNVAIRGIGTNQSTAGADNGVAIHLDGVYLAQSALATSTFLDIDRVEIVRGPQGTLFGRNATGGAINIIPNRPTHDFHAGFDVSGGVDPGTAKAQGFVSGPLDTGGNLQGRLAAQVNYNRGFARNLGASGPSRQDNLLTYGARGQIQWMASPDFDIRASVEYQREDDDGGAFYLLNAPSNAPVSFFLPGAPTGDPDKGTVYTNVGARKVNFLTATLTANLALGGGNLRGLYSFNRVTAFTQSEDDGTAVPFSDATYRQRSHQHFAELLYSSDPSRPFEFVAGANLFHEALNQNIFVTAIFLPPGFGVNIIGLVDTTSYAFFAHGTYKISWAAKLFGGVRYSHDHRSIDDSNNFIGQTSDSKSWSRVTYEVGGSADLTNSVTAYAKYATGYKSGGFSAGGLAPSFDPETNASVEAGLKGNYLDGRFQANISLFHMKYSNLQVNQIVGVSAAITNAAKATIKGLELETVAKPSDALRIEASVGLLDAKFDEFTTEDSSRPALGTLDLTGKRLPLAPTVSGSAGAYYDIPAADGTITLGARYDFKSRVYFSEFNIPVTSQAAAGRLDLTLSYKSEDGRWTGGLYARNLFDKRVLGQAYVVSATLGSLALGQYQPGRQIGVSAGYRF